jgi:hypothetical protein
MYARTLCGVLTLVSALAFESAAHASFHLMQIEKIIVSVDGDPTAQAIQLRMRSNGQNFLHNAKLVVVNAQGQNPITIVDMNADVGNGGQGERVLIASESFAAHTTPGAVPDFLMTNLIPESYFAAGSLMFRSDGNTNYWRLSWGGSAYTGSNSGNNTNDADGNFGPPVSNGLPTCGAYALEFQGGANALSTNNKADYKFNNLQTANFKNNAGNSFALHGVLPTVTASVVDGNAAEVPVSDTGKLRFTRTGCRDLALKVVFTKGGTATNGTDYVSIPGNVSIPADAGSVNVTVTAIDDATPEGNETVKLTISTNTAYIKGVPGNASVTISSNE